MNLIMLITPVCKLEVVVVIESVLLILFGLFLDQSGADLLLALKFTKLGIYVIILDLC